MKILHFVLTAQHLTGDSEVVFFPNRLKAEHYFQGKVAPLLEICERNELEEGEAFSFGQTKNIVRFDSGYDDELDAALNECNHYYYLGQIEVENDVDTYIAEFSEWVDESTIEFHKKADAVIKYNDMVDESIVMLNNKDFQVNRYNNTTWETEDAGTVFMETDNDDGSTDAFFGYTDMYYTYRIGKIEMGV
jgi:hypothetical protein